MFHPLDRFVAGDHHLRDAIAGMDFERFAAEVLQNDADLAAITWIDGGGAVWQGDGMLQSESAAGANLRFETGGQFDGKAGRHKLRFVRREGDCFDGVKVHAGIFFGAVGVAGNDGVFTQAPDLQSVQSQSIIITV